MGKASGQEQKGGFILFPLQVRQLEEKFSQVVQIKSHVKQFC
jgi:hypothetical protein